MTTLTQKIPLFLTSLTLAIPTHLPAYCAPLPIYCCDACCDPEIEVCCVPETDCCFDDNSWRTLGTVLVMGAVVAAMAGALSSDTDCGSSGCYSSSSSSRSRRSSSSSSSSSDSSSSSSSSSGPFRPNRINNGLVEDFTDADFVGEGIELSFTLSLATQMHEAEKDTFYVTPFVIAPGGSIHTESPVLFTPASASSEAQHIHFSLPNTPPGSYSVGVQWNNTSQKGRMIQGEVCVETAGLAQILPLPIYNGTGESKIAVDYVLESF